MVVGGFAVNFHGYSRTTRDLDLWVSINNLNLKAIEDSMEILGYEFDEFVLIELSNQRMVVPSEEDCVVELMPRLNISEDIGFENAYESSVQKMIDGLKYRVISLNDLLAER